MVFNTLNKTFSLQNLSAAFCCFSLRWSAASFHMLQWSWWQAAHTAAERARFSSPSRAAGGMAGLRCHVLKMAQEAVGGQVSPSPSQALAPPSLGSYRPTVPGSQHGAGPRLPALAARMSSSSSIASTLHVLRL